MELIGRFCRAPFHRQQQYALRVGMSREERLLHKGSNVRIGHVYVYAMHRVFLIAALSLEHGASTVRLQTDGPSRARDLTITVRRRGLECHELTAHARVAVR